MNSIKSEVVTFMIHHMPTLNAPTPPHYQPQTIPTWKQYNLLFFTSKTKDKKYPITLNTFSQIPHFLWREERERVEERETDQMDLGMRGWNGLGVVGTIYEEEDENSALSPFSSIHSLQSLSPTPQLSREKPPWYAFLLLFFSP